MATQPSAENLAQMYYGQSYDSLAPDQRKKINDIGLHYAGMATYDPQNTGGSGGQNTGGTTGGGSSTGGSGGGAAITSGSGTSIPQSIGVDIPASLFKIPDLNSYMSKALADVAPYYQKLLDMANGDLAIAKQQLEQDYVTGTRYNTEDVTRNTGIQEADLRDALATFGIQFPKEKEALLDSLNKRGVALTQGPPAPGSTPGAPGQLNVATEGRAGTEMGMLTEDQKLRQEAEQRTVAQNIEGINIGGKRTGEKLATDLGRGTQAAQRKTDAYAMDVSQQEQTAALGRAQVSQSQDIANQQLELQKKQYEISAKQAQNPQSQVYGNVKA